MAGDQTDDKLTREALQETNLAIRAILDGNLTEARIALARSDIKADQINRKQPRTTGYKSPLATDAKPDAGGVVS